MIRMEKRYIKIFGNSQYCETSFEECLETDMTDEQLDECAYQMAIENADGYEYLVWGDTSIEDIAEEEGCSLEEAEAIYDEGIESYYEDVYFAWEEISEEEYKDALT